MFSNNLINLTVATCYLSVVDKSATTQIMADFVDDDFLTNPDQQSH